MAQWLEAVKHEWAAVLPDQQRLCEVNHPASGAAILHFWNAQDDPQTEFCLWLPAQRRQRFCDRASVETLLQGDGVALTGWSASSDAQTPDRQYRMQCEQIQDTYQRELDEAEQALVRKRESALQQRDTALQQLAQARDRHLAELAARFN